MSNNLEQPGYQKTPTEVPTPEAHEIRSAVYGGEAKKPLSRRKQMTAMAAIFSTLVVGGIGGAVGAKLAESKNSSEPGPEVKPTITAPVVPGESEPREEPTIESPKIPQEAEVFVQDNANKYSDALATFYADSFYSENSPNQASSIVNRDYVESYDFEAPYFSTGETSPLGFRLHRMLPESNTDHNVAIEQFNEYIPDLNTLINSLALNPNYEEREVIIKEFRRYSGLGKEVQTIIDNLSGVVDKHGDSSVYSIRKAKPSDEIESNSTDWSPVVSLSNLIDGVDENGNVTDWAIHLDLTVDIMTFDNTGNSTRSEEVINNQKIAFSLAPELDPMESGLLGIG